jgi:hypothetical protein
VLDWAPAVELCVFEMRAVAERMEQQTQRELLQRYQRTLMKKLLVWRTHE